MTDQDRYRDALALLRAAATSEHQHPVYGVLVTPCLHLDWSAVHTFVSSVLDLGMTAEQALADLNDAPALPEASPPTPVEPRLIWDWTPDPKPAGASEVSIHGLEGCEEPPLPFPGVPDQPQGE